MSISSGPQIKRARKLKKKIAASIDMEAHRARKDRISGEGFACKDAPGFTMRPAMNSLGALAVNGAARFNNYGLTRHTGFQYGVDHRKGSKGILTAGAR